MKISAKGQLVHFFHGTYSAGIVLEFSNKDDATSAQKQLGDDWWIDSNCICWKGNSDELEKLKSTTLRAVKCDPCNSFNCKGKNTIHDIDSLAHSIDHGPMFTFEMEIENPNQMSFE